MKKLITITLITMLSTLGFAQSPTPTPIQLQILTIPTPVPFVRPIIVAPITLTANQTLTLLTAIANTGLMVMPEGYSLAQLKSIQNIRPDPSTSNVGGIIISGITLTPTLSPTPIPTVTP